MVATDTIIPAGIPAAIPAAWPELARLAWNRDASWPISDAEASDLHEANWRHVDCEVLTQEERGRIRALSGR